MADQPKKPAGRGGRGSQKPPQQQPSGGQAAGVAAPPATGGRARARASGAPQVAVPQQVGGIQKTAEDVAQKMGGLKIDSRSSGSGDSPPTQVGRGQFRGKRAIDAESTSSECIKTKPTHMTSTRAMDHSKNISPSGFVVNYFKVTKAPSWNLNLYRVDYKPEEDIFAIKRALLRPHESKIGAYIFDGTMLFTPSVLKGKELKLYSEKREGTKVEITIKFIKVLEPGNHSYLQVNNLIVRSVLKKLELQLVHRNFYDPKNKERLPGYNIEVWPGYDTVMRQHETDILLNVEISHKVIRCDNMYNVYRDKARENHNEFSKMVIGSIVMTTYNNMTYKVDDVDATATPLSTFNFKGKTISYVDYFKEKYDVRVNNTRQPMLVSKSKAKELRAGQPELLYLVPELCLATGLDDSMRSDFKLMKAMGDITRVAPNKRMDKLLSFRKRVDTSEAVKIFDKWDLKLDSSLCRLNGYIMPPEEIVFANGKKSAGVEADWTREFRGAKALVPAKLDKWVVITTQQEYQNTQAFMKMIYQVATPMGILVAQPRIQVVQNDRQQSYVLELDNILSQEQQTFVVVILPNNNAERYGAIKRKLSIDRPTPSQVILKKNLTNKGAMSIATKIAIQINCKLGGAPWAVEVPLKGIMVLGFDVTHDSQKRGNSYGALVASLDDKFTRYYSTVNNHEVGNELSHHIATGVCCALQKYREWNNTFPRFILMYRDGVGEGQIAHVFEHEVEQIRKAISELGAYAEGNIPLTFTIVNKRISTRIMKPEGANPVPGSVVDDVITSPERYDFYLVSQSVKQGTVSPTYYNIIYDTNTKLTPDRMQKLTYKLTHLYYNWSGTVRVPAPCQYAHKLAFLCGQSLHRAPANQLDTLLHFL